MANKNLFTSNVTKAAVTDAVNNAGGSAYNRESYHLLAQIAATNCFNGTYYSSADDLLKTAKEAALKLKDDPEFLAKVALYSRSKAHMKDMPAFLCVLLSDISKPLFRQVFRAVVDNGKMLRNVIQMARSGAVTSKKVNVSSGAWRHAIQEWFNTRNNYQLFKAYIGNDPSMRDILRMAHPKPNSPEKNALFGYFMGNEVEVSKLPDFVQQYEAYKKDKTLPVPKVDFRMLSSLELSDEAWTEIARNAPWTMTRMNLNTFARHNVFKDSKVVKLVADRLSDKEQIEKAKVFPYQLFVAWREVSNTEGMPHEVKEALHDAMELAIDNVPVLPGKGLVCVDQSGSMGSPITGYRAVSSSVSCADVAGLIASAVVRKNRNSEVYTFSNSAVKVDINPRDSVITNTKKLNSAGGGTNISAPMHHFNQKSMKADWVLYVSDNESWLDNRGYGYGTSLASEWETFKKRNPKAKLICCDLTPNRTTQIKEQPNVLQVGGWSDSCFDVMSSFLEHGHHNDHWVEVIKKIELNSAVVLDNKDD